MISQPPGPELQGCDGYYWVRYTFPWNELSIDSGDDAIDILEKPKVLSDEGCTGHRTWEAALRFASLIQTPEVLRHVQNRRILELGSGTGVLSFLSTALGASHVLATDGDSGAVERMKRGSVRNFGSKVYCSGNTKLKQDYEKASLRCKVFLWGSDVRTLSDPDLDSRDNFETVFAADVVSTTSARL